MGDEEYEREWDKQKRRLARLVAKRVSAAVIDALNEFDREEEPMPDN
tara:strand:- start:139 stop:279 length:141 start_codon:yes stop_codon:yes gene_type:complete